MTTTLVRCKDCFEYRCQAHAAKHDCSEQACFYEIDGKPVTKAQWKAYEKRHGPFNPPPTVIGSGLSGHGTPYRCAECPTLTERAMSGDWP